MHKFGLFLVVFCVFFWVSVLFFGVWVLSGGFLMLFVGLNLRAVVEACVLVFWFGVVLVCGFGVFVFWGLWFVLGFVSGLW